LAEQRRRDVSSGSAKEDRQLIEQIAAGDRRAFRQLVDKYGDRLYRFILHQVGRAAIAEELLQETFLRAYRAAPRYEERAALSSWLFRIAANLCLNQAAAASSRHEVLAEAPEPGVASPSPADELEQREVSAAVEAALTALPSQQRAAVQLARFEGMSYAEIGDVLGVSPSAVDALLQRARQTLRKRLQHLI
jgi:RNA polymerase sigma-70 factor (ECF subfamily)